MELRKIQVTGGSTHVVSLPKKWVDRSGLGRSDTLAIHEEPDGSLLVVPHSDARPKQRRITIQVEDPPRPDVLVRQLVGAYLAGADEIHFHSQGRLHPLVHQTLRDTVRDLVGVEFLDEDRESVTLQDLVGVSQMDLRKTVTRMHRIARLMFDDAVAALIDHDVERAHRVTERDDELDRLEWHVSKQMHALLEQPRLAAQLDIRPAEALNFFLVARSVERIGDHASKICRNVVELDEAPTHDIAANLREQADKVTALWDRGFTSLKRRDFAEASAAVDAGKEAGPWRGQFTERMADLEGDVAARYTIIADSIDRVRGYAIDMAETAMNHTFQSH